MDKLNRNIDEQRMNESKMNTIDYVMETISVTKEKRFSLSFTKLRLALMLSIIVIAVVSILVLDPFSTTPPAPSAPVVLTTFETEKLAELSYLSGRLIASSFSVNNQSSLMRLGDYDETEFEANIDEFNTYFDMLKVFLDDDAFSNSVTVTSLEEGDYDTSIEFYVDGKLYTFLVIVIDDEISGQLTINSQVFSVEGKYEETDTELSMELIASSGNDYIKIKYKTENEDEIEKKYEIEQYIDGIERIKEIKVSIENDEQKVEITEDNDSYELKKEIEDTIVVYKLSYEIDGVEGEVEICDIRQYDAKCLGAKSSQCLGGFYRSVIEVSNDLQNLFTSLRTHVILALVVQHPRNGTEGHICSCSNISYCCSFLHRRTFSENVFLS